MHRNTCGTVVIWLLPKIKGCLDGKVEWLAWIVTRRMGLLQSFMMSLRSCLKFDWGYWKSPDRGIGSCHFGEAFIS